MREIDYWIWLSSLTGMGPVKAKKLLELYGDPKLIFDLPAAELKNIKVLTPGNIEEITDGRKRERAGEIYRLMAKHNIKMVNLYDEAYPENLKQIFDPPIALYYTGKFHISPFSIAIVGSRRTTRYGCMAAKKISYELALRGVQIVSGLARGIDSIAHDGCLDAGGKTAAVLGCGLDTMYPPENAKLFESIVKAEGVILSEYPPGTPPLRHHFPARNRIISGISSGVLVVEAAGKSGSLITAAYALEQGREVFAVPGNIDCVCSEGTNQLIKDGAKMVVSVEDILEEFSYQEIMPGKNDSKRETGKEGNDFSSFRGLSAGEIRIAKIIGKGICQIDGIIETSNIQAKEALNLLFMMEMKGIITQLPGKNFEICRRNE